MPVVAWQSQQSYQVQNFVAITWKMKKLKIPLHLNYEGKLMGEMFPKSTWQSSLKLATRLNEARIMQMERGQIVTQWWRNKNGCWWWTTSIRHIYLKENICILYFWSFNDCDIVVYIQAKYQKDLIKTEKAYFDLKRKWWTMDRQLWIQ